jgi:hypothetical protein
VTADGTPHPTLDRIDDWLFNSAPRSSFIRYGSHELLITYHPESNLSIVKEFIVLEVVKASLMYCK